MYYRYVFDNGKVVSSWLDGSNSSVGNLVFWANVFNLKNPNWHIEYKGVK